MTTTKTCSRCKLELPAPESFYKKNTAKDGLTTHCRKCAKTPAARKQSRENTQLWRKRNPEKVNEWQRNNPERTKELQSRWRENNLERERENGKRYRAANLDAVREKNRRWQQNNREHYNQIQRDWNKANRHKVKRSESARRVRMVEAVSFHMSKKEVAAIYNSCCFACGSLDRITIEHLIPLNRSGTHSVGNCASLCMSCNTSKRDMTFSEWKYSGRPVAREVFPGFWEKRVSRFDIVSG